ncbi:MAG: DUF1559 domain-containing protein [Armatimonadota bacterium]|nr:DUF1559 domain-containing protein [Armatimonadota bacterium]
MSVVHPGCARARSGNPCQGDKGWRGFTLIEALVVLAVLALLAAVLMPTLARAREQARAGVCQSNLRQIGSAFQLYLQDYDDTYPHLNDPSLFMGRKWRWPLQPYLALAGRRTGPLTSQGFVPAVLLCPSDAVAPVSYDSTSYAYAAAFYLRPSVTPTDKFFWAAGEAMEPQHAAAVLHPAQKVLAGEWLSNHQAISSPDLGWWDTRGARNYLFADGHVRLLPAGRIRSARDGLPDPNLTVGGVAGRDID